MDRKLEVIALGMIVLVLFFTCIILGIASDKKGPEITFDKNKEIVYMQGGSDDVLMEDVKAVDKRDGDVSDSIIVVNKVYSGDGTARITYAAKDKHNNVTKIDRVIKYVPAENDNVENGDNTEQLPGESGLQPDDQNGNTGTAGEEGQSAEPTQPEVNNSADYPTADIDVAAANATGIPVIKITQTELTITEKQGFSSTQALSYVKATYDNSGDVSRRIHIEGVQDSYKEGDYSIVYTVSDTEGHVSEPVTLILHVVKTM